MMRPLIVAALLLLPAYVHGQTPAAPSSFVDKAKGAYELLFTKPVRLSLEPIAPTSGIVAGVAFHPKPWRGASVFKIPTARAAASTNKYWAVDGSFAWQGVAGHEWRLEPYARLRSMKRLNHFGIGNDSLLENRSDFALLDRRAGVYGYARPVGWLALGARGEGLWLRSDTGASPDLPSVEDLFAADQRPGFGARTNYRYIGGFANLNYPYVRSERSRRGGDYMVTVGNYHDVSGTDHSFTRIEVEGQERVPIAGVDRVLTVHGRLSSSSTSAGNSVPFYLMDTLGGADNLRGFEETVIGGDGATSTLRSFESFRFRDRTTALLQFDFRQRVWSQVFASIFLDAGVVGARIGRLSRDNVHRGVGVGVSVYTTNALAFRAELSLWGGEGHPHYLTTGRGLQF